MGCKYVPEELKRAARKEIGAISVDEVPEQVQTDWNQNDNTAPDFVKNRTHYVETVFTELIPETTVTIEEDGGYAEFQIDQQLVEGETYFVTLNGTNYECVARYWSDDDCVLIGNGTIEGDGNAGHGEPFICDSYPNGEIYLNVATAGEYTFSLSGNVMVVHKLDEKYLPETAMKSEYAAYIMPCINVNFVKDIIYFMDIYTDHTFTINCTASVWELLSYIMRNANGDFIVYASSRLLVQVSVTDNNKLTIYGSRYIDGVQKINKTNLQFDETSENLTVTHYAQSL